MQCSPKARLQPLTEKRRSRDTFPNPDSGALHAAPFCSARTSVINPHAMASPAMPKRMAHCMPGFFQEHDSTNEGQTDTD